MGEINQQGKALFSLFTKFSTNSKIEQPSPFHEHRTSIEKLSKKIAVSENNWSQAHLRTETKEIVPLKSSEIDIETQKEISLDSNQPRNRRKRCRAESLSDHGADLSFRPSDSKDILSSEIVIKESIADKSYPLFEKGRTELLELKDPKNEIHKDSKKRTHETHNVASESIKTCLDLRGQLPPDKVLDLSQRTEKATEKLATKNIRLETRPKKILLLNPVTGTIGSPPAMKSMCNLVENLENKKLKLSTKIQSSRVIKIKYNAAIGIQLDQILSSQVSRNKMSKSLKYESKDSSPKSFAKAANPMHPFFQGKRRRDSVSTTSIATLKTEEVKITRTLHRMTPKYNSNLLAVDSFSSLTKTSDSPLKSKKTAKTIKLPGSLEPPWPCRGAIHVRGTEDEDKLTALDSVVKFALPPRDKKSKGTCLGLSHDENIFTTILNDVSIKKITQNIKHIDLNEFPAIPSCLRIPTQHSEYGLDLQHRLQRQLYTEMPSLNFPSQNSSEDEICSSISRASKPVHPALVKTYASIATSLSAFDKGECESQAWTQKYSPQKAEEVLQSGDEALILKEWLTSLNVNSTNFRVSRPRKPSIMRSDSVSKRKRKSAKHDDFMISTDEEEMEELDETTEFKDEVTQDAHKRTLVRGGKRWRKPKDGSKIHHTILISGPNGCGKSAAVYAAAKELDFEVFEINSSCKRSGKDIMEKIGDMTQNHHVKKVAETARSDSIDEDRLKLDAALANDLETGRQGTMNSFLKPNASKKDMISSLQKNTSPLPLSKCKKSEMEVSKIKSDSKPAKKQKQSLILIEEAETVFKEDNQFWATIENIMAISRRPIIITCNDESVIPLAHKSLHAILRFQPSPTDLAVDYMLMVAACEGHIIKRDAVKTLYEERQSDLRASLSELNFWCQFTVGDINRGLSWYSRKRLHQDQSKFGHPMRVLSEGTYEKGMGWVSQDFLESDLPHLDIEEEILHRASDFWSLDVGDWGNSIAMRKWAAKTQNLSDTCERRRAFLGMYADFTDSMSASDLISNTLFGSENQISLDPSIPKMCNKTRDDYPVAYKLVEAFPTVIFFDTGRSISLYLRSLARNYLQVVQHLKYHIEIQPELSSPSESQIINLIRQKRTACSPYLQRTDFSRAFDPISFPQMQSFWSAGGFTEASQFDRPQQIISEDLAPYVRGIVAYDLRLQREREKMSNLISEGGTGGKRRRTTRAAMSALEGGNRSETRREKYFGNALNSHFVRKTGMQSWISAAMRWQAEREIPLV